MYHIIVTKWTAWQWMDPPTRLGIVSLCKLAQTKWKQSKLNIRWNARVRWNRETRHYIDLKSGRRGIGTNIKSWIRTKRVQFCDLCFKIVRQFNTREFGTSQLLKGHFGTMIRNTVKIKMDLRVIVSPKCENAVSRHFSLANAFFDIIFNIANSITHSWVRVTSKALVTDWTRLGKYRNERTSCYAWNMNKVRKVIFWVPDFALSRFPKVSLIAEQSAERYPSSSASGKA